MLQLLYINFADYKPLLISAILENKSVQTEVINTLIYILRNPLNN